jgi:hypothetical protein
MGHMFGGDDIKYHDIRSLELVNKFYKDYKSIIEHHSDYFARLVNIDEIVVLGLGYTNTDYIYFKQINNMNPSAEWILYYFTLEDYENAKKYVKKLEIESRKVKYVSIKEDTPYTNKVYY